MHKIFVHLRLLKWGYETDVFLCIKRYLRNLDSTSYCIMQLQLFGFVLKSKFFLSYIKLVQF